jgi:hypothetical protein
MQQSFNKTTITYALAFFQCYGSAQQPMVKRKRGRPRKDASLKRGRPRKDASLLRTAQSDKSLHENECASPLTQARRTFCSYRSSEEADKTMYPESRSPTPALGMDKDCFREMEGEVLQQTEDVASTDISLFLPSDSTRSEDVDVQKDVNQTNVTNHKGRGGNVRELQCPKCGRKVKNLYTPSILRRICSSRVHIVSSESFLNTCVGWSHARHLH